MASVLVVHRQSLQRLGLRMLLAAEPDLTVVGEATGGPEAVRMSAALGPDVVLMDSLVVDTDGVDVIRRISRPPPCFRSPSPRESRDARRAYWS